MVERSLADILSGLDPATITIDDSGRISSTDKDVAERLVDLLGKDGLVTAQRRAVNALQCYCEPQL